MALFEWASSLYEEKAVVTAGDVVAAGAARRRRGGGQVAAKTTLTAVVRSAAPVRRTFILPDRFASRPADGTVVGSVVYRADGVELGTVRLVVVTPPPTPPETPAPEPTGAYAGGPAQLASPAPAAEWPTPAARRRQPLTAASAASTMRRSSSRTSPASGSGR